MFLFCLMTALLHQLCFVFLFRKTLHDVMSYSETQIIFCTDSWSTSLGVAEVGTLKLDLRALKCRNPVFSANCTIVMVLGVACCCAMALCS